MFHKKEQDKTPQEKIHDTDIGNPTKKECRVMIIKMIKEFRRRVDAQSEKLEVFNKQLENIFCGTGLSARALSSTHATYVGSLRPPFVSG